MVKKEKNSMVFKDGGVLIIMCVIIVATIVGAISTFFLGDDNKIEEISEEIIKDETGMDIDLSPKTPEKESPAPAPADPKPKSELHPKSAAEKKFYDILCV